MSSIEVGSIVEGVVTGITNFGAFVLLPNGKTGLVHISEVADTYVRDINAYIQKKDKVKVKVLSVNGNGRIGLSIKRVTQQEEKKENVPRKNFSRKRSRFPGRGRMSFEDKLAKFLKDSDERQQDLRRNTESKRGGGRGSFRQSFS
ncbi:MAG: S1 RNA-binding domain-containing protein [Firmicutes bacterium]|nr:S1 RNA-binding domain-containing protein [Bacillota bacterium]